jgi:hypothetical protein
MYEKCTSLETALRISENAMVAFSAIAFSFELKIKPKVNLLLFRVKYKMPKELKHTV